MSGLVDSNPDVVAPKRLGGVSRDPGRGERVRGALSEVPFGAECVLAPIPSQLSLWGPVAKSQEKIP